MKKRMICVLLCLSFCFSIALPVCAAPAQDLAVLAESSLPEIGCVYEVDNLEEAFAVKYDVETQKISYYAVEESRETMIKQSFGKLPEVVTSIDIPEETVQPYTIFGSDDRIKVTDTSSTPHSAIAHLVGDRNGSYQGTAWMISANAAVTAAHCVYDYTSGSYMQNGKVYPGKKGGFLFSNPYGSAKIKEIHISSNYIQNGSTSSRYDWAVIVLDENIGDKSGYLGFKFVPRSMTGMSVTVCGYPWEDKNYQYKMTGNISDCDDYFILYNMDTSEGQSGGPIYSDTNEVVGMIIEGDTSHNIGIRIYSQLFDYLFDFR